MDAEKQRRRKSVEVRRLGPSDTRCLKVAHAALFSRNRALNKKQFFADCVSGEATGYLAFAAHPKGSPGSVLGVCCIRLQAAESSQLQDRSKPHNPSVETSRVDIIGNNNAKKAQAADDGGSSSKNNGGAGSSAKTGEQAGYILSLGVYGPQRRRGVGTALLTHIAKHLCGTVSELELHVHVTDAAATAFYASCGFAVRRTVPQYYARGAASRSSCSTSTSNNRSHDALLMAKSIVLHNRPQGNGQSMALPMAAVDDASPPAGDATSTGSSEVTDSPDRGTVNPATDGVDTAAAASRERNVTRSIVAAAARSGDGSSSSAAYDSADELAAVPPPSAGALAQENKVPPAPPHAHTGKKRKISDFFSKAQQ